MRYRRARFLLPFALLPFVLFSAVGLFFHGRPVRAQEKTASGKAAWKGYEAISSPNEAAGRYDALLAEWAARLRAEPGAPGSGLILLRLRGIRGYCREFDSLAPTLRKVRLTLVEAASNLHFTPEQPLE